jgi:hypothetical protein
MSALLDTFITMAFVYTLLSVLVTFITETWQRLQKSRGKLLKRAMIRLLNDSLNKNFAELLYEHPLVRGMRVDDKHLPSYISTPVFIDAFLDILRREAGEPQVYMTTDGQMHVAELPQKDAYQSVKDGIMAMAHSPLRVRLMCMLDNTTDLHDFKSALVTWYHEYQDGITAHFKGKARIKTFVVGAFVTFIINVDSISLFKGVYGDDQLRDVMVQEAIQWSSQNQTLPSPANVEVDSAMADVPAAIQSVQEVSNRIDSLQYYLVEKKLPVGWNCPDCCGENEKASIRFDGEFMQCIKSRWQEKSSADRITILLGWLFTAIALSFGAPVWFDVLNKFIGLRSGKPKPGSVSALTKTNNHE